MSVVYISLGSNMEDRVAYIQQAIKLLQSSRDFSLVRSSTLYETEPWGNKDQPWFVNAVIEAKTKFSPVELLHHCQEVEKNLGRVRDGVARWGQRCIDIDIIFYDNEIIDLPELIIPHKFMHKRAFVLVPILELIPLYKHPVFGKTMISLHEELQEPEDVFLYGTLRT